MNIFYLAQEVNVNAMLHCDKHLVKMITEYSQLLSTAHRMLDGKEYYEKSIGKCTKNIKRWRLNDSREELLMKATHINHPCNIWVRSSIQNYNYVKDLLNALIKEYEYRFNKYNNFHRSKLIGKVEVPKNIPNNSNLHIPQAMPEKYKDIDPIVAYRKYYVGEKLTFAKWTNREIPKFINEDLYRM